METADADTMMRPRGFFLVALLILEVLSKRKSCIFLSQNFLKIIAARLKTSLSLRMIDTKNNFLSRSPSPTLLSKRAPARAEEGNPHPPPPTTQRAQKFCDEQNSSLAQRTARAPAGKWVAASSSNGRNTRARRVRGPPRAHTPYRRRSHHTARSRSMPKAKRKRSFRDENQKQKKKTVTLTRSRGSGRDDTERHTHTQRERERERER